MQKWQMPIAKKLCNTKMYEEERKALNNTQNILQTSFHVSLHINNNNAVKVNTF
jgi:hypothetical protein